MTMKYDSVVFKTIQRQRQNELISFAIRNYDALYAWAESHGLITQEELNEMERRKREGEFYKWQKFLGTEVVSRTLGIKAIRQKYGNITLTQQPLLCRYDMTSSIGKRFECKFRTNDVEQYPTDDIDKDKKNAVYVSDEDTELIYIHWDGIVYSYDISRPCNGDKEWEKRYKTMDEDTPTVTMTKLQYDPNDALWSASTITPIWTTTIL